MRHRTTILFWIFLLALLGGMSLSAQCPATATPGQFISFNLSATFNASPAPDAPQDVWNVTPTFMSANPASGNHNTTISGTIPSSATNFVQIQATYSDSIEQFTFYTFSCTIQIASQPLVINGSCPANSFAPGDSISVPFTASGGNTKQYIWSVTPPFTASPGSGTSTTVSGVAPSQSTSFTVTLSETVSSSVGQNPASPVSKTCQIVVQTSSPLQIIGSCPTNSFAPGDSISVPFTGSGGNTKLYVWSVNAPFSVSPATGPTTNVFGSAPSGSTSFTVTLSETQPSAITAAPSVSRTCQIVVVQTSTPLQINGSCPTNSFLPGDPINVPFTASGGNTQLYVWSVTSPFTVSQQTGASTMVQGTAPQQSTSFTVTLSELNPVLGGAGRHRGAAAPVSMTCNIVVLGPLAITGACPTGILAPGTPVSIPLSGSGGSGSFRWQISAGNSGLTLSSTSGRTTTVQGTPAPGQYSFTVTLSDPESRSQPATFTCTITIASPLSITGTCPTQPVVSGTAFSLSLTASGGVPPYRWTFGDSPLTPSGSTGANIVLTGTPTSSFTLTATLQDSVGTAAAAFSCSIRVVNPLTITGPPCPVTQIQGRNVSIPLTGSGGTGNFTWTLSGPAFLSLTSSTGTTTSVTGVSNDTGTFPFTVSLADDAKTPLTAPFSCSVQIAPALSLQPTNFPDGIVSQAYPATTVNVTGGLPPLAFRISAGSLPPGLTIDSASGTVSGTPTQAGTFPFTVTVTDSGIGDARQSATANYQINVVALLQNTTACPLPTGRELQPYNAPLTATGGTGQFTFSLAGNSLLPLGLVLNNNAVTGTPQGPFPPTNLTFQVTSGSQTQTFTCGLTILGRIPTVTVNGFFTNSGSSLVTATISVDAPVQEDVKGTAVLTFTPDVPNANIKDNPQVQFCGGNAGDPLCSGAQKDSAGLLRVIPFTLRAGLPSVDLSPLVTSNVAGTIQIALTNLTVGSQSFTAAPLRFTIPRSAPLILPTPVVTLNGHNLNVTLKVASSTCELTSATSVFTGTPGSDLVGASNTTNLSSLFSSLSPSPVDATHAVGGCAFTLNLPYSIDGDPSVIATVAITLTSTAGSTSTGGLPVR